MTQTQITAGALEVHGGKGLLTDSFLLKSSPAHRYVSYFWLKHLSWPHTCLVFSLSQGVIMFFTLLQTSVKAVQSCKYLKIVSTSRQRRDKQYLSLWRASHNFQNNVGAFCSVILESDCAHFDVSSLQFYLLWWKSRLWTSEVVREKSL